MKLILLICLYFITGKLGLAFAVPPGYATVIWPPSGIAAGALIVCGYRMWPAIFIGSFLLNCHISGITFGGASISDPKLLAAMCIAGGSTIQAVFARYLAERFFGIPIRLDSVKQVCGLMLLLGPLACLIAATIGASTLHAFGLLDEANFWENWLSWWIGDIAGIVIFLPLVLIAPGTKHRLIWKGQLIGSLPLVAMIALMVPLGLTFYAWKITSENIHQHGQDSLRTLAMENEKALMHRLDSYSHALLGGAGFFQGSEHITRQEWRSYVDTLEVTKNFPGINGIGWVKPVEADKLQEFLDEVRADGAPYFNVHPTTKNRPYNVITYIEPEIANRQAVGLNIGYEDNRLEATTLARDNGLPAITKRIVLVQDAERTAGFLLLHPMYEQGKPVNTIEERRAAFLGWIYAPFVAKNFLNDLTGSQGQKINLSIYDGTEESPDKLIYRSNELEEEQSTPLFVIRKNLHAMQQNWLVVWSSTAELESESKPYNAAYVLFGGLILTLLFATYLMINNVHDTQTMHWLTEDKWYLLPAVIFVVAASLSYAFYRSLDQQELQYTHNLVEEKLQKIEQLIQVQSKERILALKRMAQRWGSAGGTPQKQWRDDAANYVYHIPGLETVEWVDNTFHVRWMEPVKGNEHIINLDIRSDDDRTALLMDSQKRNLVVVTPPTDVLQGYKAIIAYAPLRVQGEFQGFIVGIFNIDAFLNALLQQEVAGRYGITLSHKGKVFYDSGHESKSLAVKKWKSSTELSLYNTKWTIEITPTKEYMDTHRTYLPLIVLIGGLLFSVLLSITSRNILIARIKSRHLQASEETFRSAMEYASIGMALVDLDGSWLKVNKSLCDLLGYTEEELRKIDFQSITHPDDLSEDLNYVKQLLASKIESYQMEKRYFHKHGHTIWALLSVSLARDDSGRPEYFIAQIQDITERKEMERMKSEFISIVSHELRTPLTSIRGSLGLILGAMSKDLPEKVAGLINIAHSNCERLILLINDILDIDKIASGQMRFDMKSESLAIITARAAEANQAYAQKYNTSIKVEPIAEDVQVRVDANRYIQALSNLLSNAAKYSPENTPIRIVTEADGKNVRIQIIDKGPGIPEEFHARIFSKFSQADSSATRSKGGTGLGLHITKQIIEHMHGKIGFETSPKTGTTFWIELPRVDAPKRKHEDTVLLYKKPRADTPHILHVEDDADLSNVLATALHDEAELVTASNLQQARGLIKEGHFALIVLDIGLPDGSGVELLDDLEAMGLDAPVVILSADTAPEAVRKRVKAAMVKSMVSETKIVETIISMLNKNRKGNKDA